MYLSRANTDQGHRLLTFITTSDYSTLKMLKVDRRFEIKVPVPAVTNLQELGTIFQEMGVSGGNIKSALGQIQQRTGSDRVDVGVKTIMKCVERATEDDDNVSERLADLMVENI